LQSNNNHINHAPLTVKPPPQSKRSFQHYVERILVAKAGYFSDQLYRFQALDNDNFQCQPVSTDSKPNLHWLILGREHYFETSKVYPIANKRDLQKAVNFDDNKAPYKGVTLTFIERINEQSHRVTFWVINPKVFTAIACKPWLILPESYVLAKSIGQNVNLATIDCINKSLFIAKTGLGISSGIKSKQINTIDYFAFSTGSPLNNAQNQQLIVEQSQFSSQLHLGLKSMEFQHLAGFFVPRVKTDWKKYPWKFAAMLTGSFFAFYLALSSTWLIYQDHQIEQQLAEQSDKVDKVLLLQKQLSKQQQWQGTLSAPLQQQIPYWNVWPLVLESINAGASVTGLDYKNDKITIHGITNAKATDILAKLSQNMMVIAPAFSTPVRKRRGREEFAISFTLNPKISLDDITKTSAKVSTKVSTKQGKDAPAITAPVVQDNRVKEESNVVAK
jgi:hypothetical protein